MKKHSLFTILFFALALTYSRAQDTLPKFSLLNAGNNRIIIGWVNNFENVKQISIQRSPDSLTGYKTILTVADPASPQNGYLDSKAPNDRMFYRIYIMLDKGMYLFSNAKRPVKDTTLSIAKNIVTRVAPVDSGMSVNDNNLTLSDSVERARPFVIKLEGFPGSKDTVAVPTPVTLKKPAAFVPSLYVYTCRDGYICVKLPDDEKIKKYSIKFFKDDLFLFELKDLKEREFKLDKTNFYQAGWFRFELYEESKLVEKHKFYLERDF